MVKLVHDWQKILKQAWSVRLIMLAVVLSGVEVYLSFAGGIEGIPNGAFAAASGITSGLAFAARLLAQRSMDNAPDQTSKD